MNNNGGVYLSCTTDFHQTRMQASHRLSLLKQLNCDMEICAVGFYVVLASSFNVDVLGYDLDSLFDCGF